MATIDLKKIRKTSGSYYRITGNKQISNLMTAIQAAAISNGNQVAERFRLSYTGNLPLFYGKEVNTIVKTLKVLSDNKDGCIIFGGFILDENSPKKNKKKEVDVIIFINDKLYCYEIKDGNSLDTKKAVSEINLIESFVTFFESKNFKVEVGLISVNMVNGEHSIKDFRANKYLISGKDFSEKFSFDFNFFCDLQKNEQPYNEQIIIDEMKKIIQNYDDKK